MWKEDNMNKKSRFATIQIIVYYFAAAVCVLAGIVNALTIDNIENPSAIEEFLCMLFLILLIVALVIIFCFAIGDIFYSVNKYKSRDMDKLLDGVIKIKLFTIPCYMINYIVCAFWCLFLLCTIVASFAGIVLAVVFTFVTCLVIAATGAYGIAFIKLFNEMPPENPMGKVHYVLQVLPCLDVVSTVILMRKYKKIHLSVGERI